MKNSNENIANRTYELPACDPVTSPPYFRLYTAFWGDGKRAKPENLQKYLLETGGKSGKNEISHFCTKGKVSFFFFFKFWILRIIDRC